MNDSSVFIHFSSEPRKLLEAETPQGAVPQDGIEPRRLERRHRALGNRDMLDDGELPRNVSSISCKRYPVSVNECHFPGGCGEP